MITTLLGIAVVALGLFGLSSLIWAGRVEARLGIMEERYRKATLAVEAQMLRENQGER